MVRNKVREAKYVILKDFITLCQYVGFEFE